ncbi:hypothetical protein [Virgibacillus subterraneus]|nr:hypothetical protein [Virgibacillus subterraneus]
MEDLRFRQTQKVFIVSSFDTVDLSNLSEYSPIEVAYDVLEEDPDYHQRVLDNLNKRRHYFSVETSFSSPELLYCILFF